MQAGSQLRIDNNKPYPSSSLCLCSIESLNTHSVVRKIPRVSRSQNIHQRTAGQMLNCLADYAAIITLERILSRA